MSDSSIRELNQWKDERIKSLKTPELSSVDKKSDDDKNVCKPLPDLGTTTKATALTNAIKENENLKRKLLYITKENTSLLKEMSKLKEKQMKLEDDLREVSNMEELDTKEEDSEYAKLEATAKRQHVEIERLKSDVQRLRSKCGHVSKETMLCSV
jgi:predicted RNase H-like nuclease (RuvC/YqgF family)